MEQGLNINELKEKRLNLLVALGEEVHNLVRGEENVLSDKVRSLSEEVKKVDIQIGKNSSIVDKTTCPKCQGELQEDSVFCSKCGFAAKEYFAMYVEQCDYCKAPMKTKQNYCNVCGTKQTKVLSLEKAAE